jgi:mRNA-degrading endonuclease YafQ of YafQ-DinJ toxin-antitoxin module
MPTGNIKYIHYHPDLLSKFQKLPTYIQDLAKKKERWFIANPYDPRPKIHKLKGELKDLWAYSINRDYRVLFRFISSEEVIYYDIGTYGIYR